MKQRARPTGRAFLVSYLLYRLKKQKNIFYFQNRCNKCNTVTLIVTYYILYTFLLHFCVTPILQGVTRKTALLRVFLVF